MFPKLLVLVLFLGILASLGSALLRLVRKRDEDDGRDASERMAKALTVRVGLSVGLFILLFVLFALGVIQPHGLTG